MTRMTVLKEWARTMEALGLDLVVAMKIPGTGGGIVDESPWSLWHLRSCSGEASSPAAAVVSFARSAAAVPSATAGGFAVLSRENQLRRPRLGGKLPTATVEEIHLRLHWRSLSRDKTRCCC